MRERGTTETVIVVGVVAALCAILKINEDAHPGYGWASQLIRSPHQVEIARQMAEKPK